MSTTPVLDSASLRDAALFVDNRLRFYEVSDWAHTMEACTAGLDEGHSVVVEATFLCGISRERTRVFLNWAKIASARDYSGIIGSPCEGCGRTYSLNPPSSGFAIAQQTRKNHKELMTQIEKNHKELMNGSILGKRRVNKIRAPVRKLKALINVCAYSLEVSNSSQWTP